MTNSEASIKPVRTARDFPPNMLEFPPHGSKPSDGWVQVVDLAAAASGFSEAQDPQAVGWVQAGH